ncbi:hypothetical protein HQQ94_05360 [Shewanella sp. VB17]|uniref:hypothetical protein n=1 Tax=Shewanella sp. VB17 TaxID=2739432 RepID=UPI00156520DA|nr:hypothetical protein [Shewanella sp. VB17]NRD72684.1 hypothetical protein [Shewanella sp. VB17]
MQNEQQKMSIKVLRHGLTQWGRYWQSREYGQGHASRSACDKLGEIRGPSVIDFEVPSHVLTYDRRIEALSSGCRRALRVHYLCQRNWALVGFDSKKSYLYWLRRAESALFE